jgi:hydrogenase maturation protease
MKVLVLGIGNRLMMDDGIGLYVVEALQEQQLDERIKLILGETDIDYCLHVIEDTDVLIIVDAMVSGNTAGEVALFPLETFKALDPGITAHNLHLFQMIPIVYPHVRAYIIGIEADKVDFGLGLSEELDKSFHHIVKKVNSLFACIHTSNNGYFN